MLLLLHDNQLKSFCFNQPARTEEGKWRLHEYDDFRKRIFYLFSFFIIVKFTLQYGIFFLFILLFN